MLVFVKHVVCDTEDETFGTPSLAKNAAERRNNERFGAPRGARPADKVRPGDDCVRLSPGDVSGGLRVRGERSKQDLRHVLLAQGHQDQRQALIGRVHAAALRTKKNPKKTDKQQKHSEKTGREVSGKGDMLQRSGRCLREGVSDPIDEGLDPPLPPLSAPHGAQTTLKPSQTSWSSKKHPQKKATDRQRRVGGTGSQQPFASVPSRLRSLETG